MTMATDKLFHRDAYLTSFEARLLDRRTSPAGTELRLDQTAFYATSGGQPHDTGRLGGARVVDVVEEEGMVWHRLDAPLPVESTSEHPPDRMEGVIDWERRFDHMQQHSGQHILSQALIRTSAAETVSFHLGPERVTIDLGVPDLAPADIERAEEHANRIVDDNLEIRTHWTTRDDLARFPLRKPPQVDGAIRIMEIDGFDWSACAGTHVSRSGGVGVIKILGRERYKGGVRVEFLCGARARRDYAWKHEALRLMAGRFSTLDREVEGQVARLAEEARELRRRLRDYEEAALDREAERLADAAEATSAGRLVRLVRDIDSLETLTGLAGRMRLRPGLLVLLAGRTPDGRGHLVLARAADLPHDMNQTLRAVLPLIEGRGGGRPEMAQGAGSTAAGLEAALAAASAALLDTPTGRG